MAYTTETDIENYLLTDIDSSFSSQITSWIASVKQWIDNYTNRTFEVAASTKKFDGNGKNSLYLDDLLSVDTIWFTANDSTSDAQTETLATTDFYLYQNDDPNKTPYNKILINPNGDYRTFEYGKQNIWIKGSWGYSATVPDDIKMVATKLVASLIKAGKDEGVQSFSQGDYSVTYRSFQSLINNDLGVKDILDWYKKKTPITGYKISRI